MYYPTPPKNYLRVFWPFSTSNQVAWSSDFDNLLAGQKYNFDIRHCLTKCASIYFKMDTNMGQYKGGSGSILDFGVVFRKTTLFSQGRIFAKNTTSKIYPFIIYIIKYKNKDGDLVFDLVFIIRHTTLINAKIIFKKKLKSQSSLCLFQVAL